MTINKSQKQFLKHVDVDIRIREIFTHDQLYVTISRVTKKKNLRIIVFDELITSTRWIRNVQWKQILLKTFDDMNKHANRLS